MHLPFKNGLKIRLHLSTIYFYHYAQRHTGTWLDFVQIRTYNLYFTIFNLMAFFCAHILKGWHTRTADFNLHVFSSDTFTFKGRTISYRDIQLMNRNLQAAYFDTPINDLVNRYPGNYVLVRANPRR